MKKILPFILSLPLLAGCEFLGTDDFNRYVVDYDYSATYFTYQYDLRSFVVGEGMKFKFGAVLAGVIENEKDRNVHFTIDDGIVTGDLSKFGESAGTTAFNGMTGGKVSQSYVKDAITASGIKALSPLPSSMYSLSEEGSFVISKGMHTGSVTVRADSAAFLADPNAGAKPYYALGIRLVEADVDTILLSKSYTAIAVRCENQFFGYWYHSGKSKVTDASGNTVSEESYSSEASADANTSAIYLLTSATPFSVRVNCFHNRTGESMTITNANGKIAVSSADGSITDTGSDWNHDILMQSRELYLNYRYGNPDGSTTAVTDTLRFRNRIRDGVSEWQDEVREHYNHN